MNSYISLHFILAIHVFMDEFPVADNLYRLWHHIWPMSVFDHRPKALSFPIRVYLCGFNARGQHVYKLCIFSYGFYTLLNRLQRILKALVLFYFIKWCYLRSIAGLNTSTPIIRPNMKFCIRARNLVAHRCEISKVFGGLSTDRCSKFPS